MLSQRISFAKWRATKCVALVAAFCLCLGTFSKGSSLTVPSGTWVPAASLRTARTGAASALLKDGRVLVTGGERASGILSSSELYNSVDDTFAPAAPMGHARSRHVAVALNDGRVLVAAGETPGGVTTSAEIYNPATDSWSPAGDLTDARADATATLLNDGRVLIAGGTGTAGVLASLEIFDPTANAFMYAGLMVPGRTEHAAAALRDGRVLIVGGSNGSGSLTSVEIYDPETGSVVPGPELSTARAGHSATTLLDGTILVVGGHKGKTELASAELYDPQIANFSPIAGRLATARREHLAFLLPHNNSLVIVGGTSNGVTLSSAELFVPWTSTFRSTGWLATARNKATGTPLADEGLLMVVGGVKNTSTKLATAELYGFATVKTDKDDYSPGQTVTITGSGWEPGETVTLRIQESPAVHEDQVFTAKADSSGRIVNTGFHTASFHFGVRFYLTATGMRSQAQTTFTDGFQFTVGISPTTVASGTPRLFTLTVQNISAGKFPLECVVVNIPAGAGTPTSLSVSANDPGPQLRGWFAPTLSGGTMTTKRNGGTTNAIDPGGTVAISFTTTATTTGAKTWTTSAYGNTDCASSPFPAPDLQPTVDVTAGTGTIVVVKDALPSDPQDFTFTTGGLSPSLFTLDDDEGQGADGSTNVNTLTFSGLPAGSYSVTEGATAGWDLSPLVCADQSGGTTIAGSTANVDLAAGETVTCTFTSTKHARLIVEQRTLPNTALDSFSFTSTLTGLTGSIPNGLTLTQFDVLPGSYTVTEGNPGPLGFDLSSIACDDGSSDTPSTGHLPSRTATFNVGPGETIRCTFTNSKRGTIRLAAQTNPDGLPDLLTFTGNAAGSIADNGQITVANLAPGIYSSTQNAVPAGFDLTAIVCDDGGSPTPSQADLPTRKATFRLDAGETVTCTFTNTKRGTIIVEKQTDPDDAPGSFTFTGTAAGSIGDNGKITVSNLVPGLYTSTENDSSPAFDLTDVFCDDGGPSESASTGDVGTRTGTFRLDAGETVTCTFVSTKRGTVVVIEDAIPNDAQDFSFTTTGGLGVFTLDDDGDGTLSNTQVFEGIPAGNYSVSETPLAAWDLTTTCVSSLGHAETALTLTLNAGETITCTFTNTKRGTITVVKDTEPHDGQDFSFTTTGGLGAFSLDDDADGTLANTVSFPNVVPGAYSVTEAAVPVSPGPAAQNPVTVENEQTGSANWNMWLDVANDVNQQIKGYASATSVNKGETITFHVTVNPAQSYTMDVYRMGWYQGLGGRLLQHIGPLNGVQQPLCPVDAATGRIECNWTPSYELTVPTTWTSGVFLVQLTNAQGYQNYITFVVRDDARSSDLLYQASVTTYQAYNNYPDDGATGKSLYEYNSFGANTVAGTSRAVNVSFDRPYANNGSGQFLAYEVYFVRWLERAGYDVSYSTDLDTHEQSARLLSHKAFLSVGNDEYWSKAQYDGVEQARDAGVHLGFFGANAAYWQVRFEASPLTDAPDRVMVCYKDAALDPVQGPTTTTVWRDPFLGRPEQRLLGVQYFGTLNGEPAVPYVATNTSHWVYDGTGLSDGDSIPGIEGGAIDSSHSATPLPTSIADTYVLLSQSPVSSSNGQVFANASIYQAPSGAWVFAAGTITWSDGLDRPGVVDARIQQITANVLNRFQVTSELEGHLPPGTGFDLTALACTSSGIGTAASGNVLSRTASITLGAGGAVTCTFSDTKRGALTIVKNTVPNDGQDFHFTGSGPAGFTFGDGFVLDDDVNPLLSYATTFGNLVPGTYMLTEAASDGFNTTVMCSDGTTSPTATLTVDISAGEGVTCTFTSTKRGTIIVVQDANPNDTQDFAFTTTGGLGPLALDDDADGTLLNAVTFADLVPGSYSVRQTVPAGWDLTTTQCVSSLGHGETAGALTLNAGETITCTFTNTKRGSITIVKDTEPNDGQDFSFTTTGGLGVFSLDDDADGTLPNTVTFPNVVPGPYSVTEAAASVSSGSVAQNPIMVENQQPGSSAWQISGSSTFTMADDVGQQIKGYASATSVNKGEAITFHVSVNAAQTYTMDVYRMGWYQGLGGRLLQHIGPLSGVHQPACPVDAATGRIECNWTPAYTLTVPTTWTSGVFLVLLTNAQGYQNYITFVVRDDARPADLLFQASVTTYQAYNNYPNDGTTGKSLYYSNSFGATTVGGTTAAVKVSFDRPYANDGSGQFLEYEVHFLRWLEQAGYDVSYATDLDTHQHSARLLSHKAFLSVGHDEYWSKAMYDGVEQARDAGVHLGFFGANEVYWQVRFEASPLTGTADRVMVCYKSSALDPVQGPTTTVQWRDAPVNRPEQRLVGVQYFGAFEESDPDAPYVATNTSHWVYNGTGMVDGDTIARIEGVEVDASDPTVPLPTSIVGTYTLLSHSPVITSYGPGHANASIYQAPGGAWVFGAGSITWSYGLGLSGWVDVRIQQITANILNRFVLTADLDGSVPPVTGFDLTALTCTPSGTGTSAIGTLETRTAAITLGPGGSVTCTFTNTKRGTIVVVQDSEPNDPQDFAFTTTGGLGAFALDDDLDETLQNTQAFPNVVPGSYSVSETPLAGWNLTTTQCESSLGHAETAGALTLNAGETITCTFTNTKRATVTVVKTTLGGDATFSYSGTLGVTSLATIGGTASQLVSFSNVEPGGTTRTVQEGPAPAGWDFTSLTCADPDGGTTVAGAMATLDIDPGEAITCTFVNTKRGSMSVDEVTIPGGDPTSFSFTTSGPDYGSFSLTDSSAPNVQSLAPAAYSVAETLVSGWNSFASCVGGPFGAGASYTPGASIVVQAGDAVSCTFTSTKSPTLRLVKTVVNDNGGTKVVSDFPMFVNGSPVTSGVVTTLAADVLYTATETGLPGYAASVWGGDCAADGTITLAVGDAKTCTITNNDVAPTLTLVKTVVNDNGGSATPASFTLTATGPTSISGPGGAVSEQTFSAGTYALTETALPGYTAGPWVCTGTGTQTGASIALQLGQNATCTIANDDEATDGHILIVKQTLPAGDPTIFSFTASFDPAGFTLGSGQSHASGAVAPGVYSVGETPSTGWNLTSAVCSDGSPVNHVDVGPGETVTCTFTNTKPGYGLVAAYGFNQGSGTTLADSSGTGNNGTISGATWTAGGRYGKALSFNGTSNYVRVNEAPSLDLPTAMTLEAWVKPTSVTGWRPILYKESAEWGLVWALYASDKSAPPSVYATTSGGADQWTHALGKTMIPLNAWTHIAGTYDGVALKLYVNGVLVKTAPHVGTTFPSASPLYIAGRGSQFAGLIDEVRVYSRALSQAEILADSATPLP